MKQHISGHIETAFLQAIIVALGVINNYIVFIYMLMSSEDVSLSKVIDNIDRDALIFISEQFENVLLTSVSVGITVFTISILLKHASIQHENSES